MGGNLGGRRGNRAPKRKPRINKLKFKKRKKNSVFNPSKLPDVTPNIKCRLRLCRQERIKDFLLIEQDFVRKQEEYKKEKEANLTEMEKAELEKNNPHMLDEKKKVDSLRGTPLLIGILFVF